MINNYFKVAWRNFTKSKFYSLINVVSLATGMAVSILIGLWVWDELTFDAYGANYTRVAQVMDTQTAAGTSTTSDAIAIPLADELRTKYSQDFSRVALVFPPFIHTLAFGDKKIAQTGSWVEPEFPNILSLHMLEGNIDALQDPSSVLINHSLAKSLFNKTNPLGKQVRVDNMMVVSVAGVFEDLPKNSTFSDTKLFLPWSKAISTMAWVKEAQTEWDNRYWKLFVQMRFGVDMYSLNKKIEDLAKGHVKAHNESLLLNPMARLHLYNEFKNGKSVGGRIEVIWFFGMIGLSVLLLACINFMNLATARSEKRAKEVGLRKSIGSLRWQLAIQFLSESLLVSLFAGVLAVAFLIPYLSAYFWLSILLVVLLVGLVAGSYPAFYLSAFSPIEVLKGKLKVGPRSALPRQILVILQFAASIALIFGTIIVFQQIQYAKNRPVGYLRQGLIAIPHNTPELYGAPYNSLRTELLKTGAVADIARSSSNATETPPKNVFTWKGSNLGAAAEMGIVGITHDYGHTSGWEILQGRDFSRNFPSDSGGVILNEAAAKVTGFARPIGELIRFDNMEHVVTGVVKNMVMESPYAESKPTVFYLEYNWFNVLLVRIKPGIPVRTALLQIEGVLKKFNPGGVFDYKFVDNEYAKKFSDEELISKIVTTFAALAILISCLGLFGLASFVAELRTKEIGIRKVLGASTDTIWKMLSQEFVTLVVISFLIAVPLSWHFMNEWLAHYRYRIAISWWIFPVAGVAVLLITLLTVSYHALKAASANPITSLRAD